MILIDINNYKEECIKEIVSQYYVKQDAVIIMPNVYTLLKLMSAMTI